MYKIVSDGGCDFSKEEIKRYNIDVIPFYITFDQENYLKEGVDITREEYFDRLIADKALFPKTSQPNPQDYIDFFTPYLKAGMDIVYLAISSKLSGSYASANLAVDMLKEDFPDRKIVVVDSLNVCVGQGLILREMIKMRDAGYNLNENIRMAREVIKTARVYFTLDSLEYLKRGGRVGPTTALVGNLLGLRPILQLEDGQVSQLESVRGKKRAIKLMEEAIVATLADEKDNINLCVGHIRSEDEAISFKAATEASLGIEIATPIVEVGVTIGTHAGPGALAFAYCRKYEAIKIKENVA